jgi:hypothetical protein
LDHLRVRLLNNDYLFVLNRLGFYFHLFVRFQSLVLGLLPHALDGIHNVALLRQEGVAEIGGPLNVVAQAFHHIGEGGHSLDAWIPRLFRDGIRQGLVFQILVFA